MAIAADKISPAFEATRKIFFPIRGKFWLKIGFISLLSAYNSNRGTGSNVPTNLLPSDAPVKIWNFIRSNIALIGFGFGLFYIVNLVFNIIQHIFSFILIDSVITGNVEIGNSFHKNKSKGISTFLFWFVFGIIFLIIFGLLALPLLIPIVKNLDNLSFSLINIPYLIFFIFIFIIFAIISGIITFVFRNFVLIDMYLKDIKCLKSFGRMFKLVRAELKETFIYLLLKIALGIGAAIIVLLLLIPFLIILFIIGAIFVGLGILAFAVGGNAIIIYLAIAIPLGLVFFILWIYAYTVVSTPIPAFFINYSYLFLMELNKRNRQLFIG